MPLASEKTVFPCTCLDFLGITIDTTAMECRLPPEKLIKLRQQIKKVLSAKKVQLKEFQSLLGLLNFACRVIPVGRIFLRRLYFSTVGCNSPFSHIRISSEIKEDLQIWNEVFTSFSGCSLWQGQFIESQALQLFTDAAGSSGFGAFFFRANGAHVFGHLHGSHQVLQRILRF